MKKVLIPVFVFLGGAYFYNAYRQSKAAQSLQYQPGSFKFDSVTVQDVKAHGTIDVINNTNTAITVNGINGDVLLNNSVLASFNNSQRFILPANSRTSIPFNVTGFTATALKTILGSLSKSLSSQVITLRGQIYWNGLTLPFAYNYRLKEVITIDVNQFINYIMQAYNYYQTLKAQN